jgi:hypothetical protein
VYLTRVSISSKYDFAISPHTDVDVEFLDGVTHTGAAVDPDVRPVVQAWLEN